MKTRKFTLNYGEKNAVFRAIFIVKKCQRHWPTEGRRRRGDESLTRKSNQSLLMSSPTTTGLRRGHHSITRTTMRMKMMGLYATQSRFGGAGRGWAGEEFIDLRVELVGVLDEGGVTGSGHDPKFGVGNVLEDFDGVLNRDEVVIAADNERRATDGMKGREGNVGLLKVEHEKLPLVSSVVGLPDFIFVGFVVLLVVGPEAGREGRGVRLVVGAGGGELDDFVGVAHGQLERDNAAIAPADYIGGFDVEGIEQGGLVVGHHFESERSAGVFGFALRTAVGSNDVVFGGEIRNVVGEGTNAAAVSVDHEEGHSGPVLFAIHFNAVDVVEFAGVGIVAIGNGPGLERSGSGERDERKGGEQKGKG